jgi:hypothetical protein
MAFCSLHLSNADIVAIQLYADEHGHPVGMMSKLFDNLYHDEVGFCTILLLFLFSLKLIVYSCPVLMSLQFSL